MYLFIYLENISVFIWLCPLSIAIFVLKKFNDLLKCYQERQRD